ncbi:fibronectin type III domain-containing protein [Candidatus Peregrinibacteria bacterium]|nr:fibronectin type III domain-containing protein [Candidatus Peregrinibacteria bacterium]
MKTKNNYQGLAVLLAVTLGIAGVYPAQTAFGATADTEIFLRPHCMQTAGNGGNTDWLFGPIPSGELIAETEEDGPTAVGCTTFQIKDPQTLQTTTLREGDILDMDLVVSNPGKKPISRVRAWLTYDPKLLKGELLTIDSAFPVTVPGEKDFFAEEGYAKIDASTESEGPDERYVTVARLQFKILKTSSSGTPIGFHDAQADGHTVVESKEGNELTYVLGKEPGTLLVTFRGTPAETGTDATEADEDTEEVVDPEEDIDVLSEGEESIETDEGFNPLEAIQSIATTPQKKPAGESCIQNQECETGLCIAGICVEAGSAAVGSSCSVAEECASGICNQNVCVSGEDRNPLLADASAPQRTAFALLQIQNLRVTTEGSAVFLGWDHLRSSALASYNIYYGTTSGKYIQRKTIGKEDNTITIRSLPTGVQYYFAVRGISAQKEESAFSREVAVTVGNPASATMPLERGSIDIPGNPLNADISDVVEEVPGETGIPSFVGLIAVTSAIAGTLIAARRQMIVMPTIHE